MMALDLDKDKSTSRSTPLVQILEAANFAARAHAGQKRKGAAGEPYIDHLIEVAELVARSGYDSDVNLIMACFLHDVVEDTSISQQEIARVFNDDVASLVMEATDDKTLPKQTRKARQVQTAPHKSARAQALKLADKISNLRAILLSPPLDWTPQRKREYFDWAKAVVSGFTEPNQYLLNEFQKTYDRIAEIT
jgi:GTP diphosphokinase / guanosine-3',5'-bis(diphosphate) 3'-diphosphatase